MIHDRVIVERSASLSALQLFCNIFIIAVQEKYSSVRNSVSKLKLRLLDVFHAFECIQMLRTYRSNKSVMRVHKIAVFLDLSHISGSHLADEYLMCRLQELPDSDNDSHRSIVALRSHEHSVSLPQQSLEVELYARLSVASGDTDNGEIRILLKYALRIVYVMVVHTLFNRTVDAVCKHVFPKLKPDHRKQEASKRSQIPCFDPSVPD